VSSRENPQKKKAKRTGEISKGIERQEIQNRTGASVTNWKEKRMDSSIHKKPTEAGEYEAEEDLRGRNGSQEAIGNHLWGSGSL